MKSIAGLFNRILLKAEWIYIYAIHLIFVWHVLKLTIVSAYEPDIRVVCSKCPHLLGAINAGSKKKTNGIVICVYVIRIHVCQKKKKLHPIRRKMHPDVLTS